MSFNITLILQWRSEFGKNNLFLIVVWYTHAVSKTVWAENLLNFHFVLGYVQLLWLFTIKLVFFIHNVNVGENLRLWLNRARFLFAFDETTLRVTQFNYSARNTRRLRFVCLCLLGNFEQFINIHIDAYMNLLSHLCNFPLFLRFYRVELKLHIEINVLKDGIE